MGPEQKKKVSKLSKDLLHLSRNTLLVRLRFLDVALSKIKYHEVYETTMATDGVYIFYSPVFVLKRYKDENEIVTRDYLHLTFHCIFMHMFVNKLIDRDCWNLACDIAVEYSIYSLGLKSLKTKNEQEEIDIFKDLEEKGIMITAEKLYRYFVDQHMDQEELKRMRKIFGTDDHDVWYTSQKQKESAYGLSKSGNANSSSHSSSGAGGNKKLMISGMDLMEMENLKEEWKNISKQVQMYMNTFSKMQGNTAGAMVQNLKEVNREKYDYTSFLKKFSVMGEVMKVNNEEFDYVYYTYGLKLFKKVPLIEPLEYKETNIIKEFVIAIDTSGSTSGELVQKFVQKTYNILKTGESFCSRMNLHIIQCDAEIQEHVKITCQEEFDDYLSTMMIRGLGDTNFVPVFETVDQMIDAGEFVNLKGLIYFTDGYGLFPRKKPDYETAFVFVDSNITNGVSQFDIFNPEVPSWAIKLVLQTEEI